MLITIIARNVANSAITFNGLTSMKHAANSSMVINIFNISPIKNRCRMLLAESASVCRKTTPVKTQFGAINTAPPITADQAAVVSILNKRIIAITAATAASAARYR